MTAEGMQHEHDHVSLLAGFLSDGRAVYEPVPAAAVTPGVYDVLGSPAMAYGCAAGDRIEVGEDGTFQVLRRGGNVCLVLLPAAAPSDADVADLREEFQQLGGAVELPRDRRFIVVTVPAAASFPAIEAAVNSWTTDRGCAWEYGNVYDEDGNALGWWTAA